MQAKTFRISKMTAQDHFLGYLWGERLTIPINSGLTKLGPIKQVRFFVLILDKTAPGRSRLLQLEIS